MSKWATRFQTNAILVTVILGILLFQIVATIKANDLETHEIQILGAALVAGMGGMIYVAKAFANDPDDGAGGVCPSCVHSGREITAGLPPAYGHTPYQPHIERNSLAGMVGREQPKQTCEECIE